MCAFMSQTSNRNWFFLTCTHCTNIEFLTVAEWKESFIITGHAFIQYFIQKEEQLVLRVICHYAISGSLHMRSPFSFGVRSDRVFTCTLNRIRKGINHPFIPIKLSWIKEFTWRLFSPTESSIRLQTDYCLHVNITTEKLRKQLSLLQNDFFDFIIARLNHLQ